MIQRSFIIHTDLSASLKTQNGSRLYLLTIGCLMSVSEAVSVISMKWMVRAYLFLNTAYARNLLLCAKSREENSLSILTLTVPITTIHG